MSVGSSSRMWLDTLATHFALLYDFSMQYKCNPTIGDVLKALDENSWNFRVASKDEKWTDFEGFQQLTKKGDNLISVGLDAFLDLDEWNTIRKFNSDTNTRIHCGGLPLNSKNKPYVIIPHEDVKTGLGAKLQEISTKIGLVSNINDLEIKDELLVSEGSSSDGTES